MSLAAAVKLWQLITSRVKPQTLHTSQTGKFIYFLGRSILSSSLLKNKASALASIGWISSRSTLELREAKEDKMPVWESPLNAQTGCPGTRLSQGQPFPCPYPQSAQHPKRGLTRWPMSQIWLTSVILNKVQYLWLLLCYNSRVEWMQ